MANHSLTIAKASFAAACLRPDVKQVSREDIAHFHSVFEAALWKCSPVNVQKCKEWLIENIVPSTHRTVALGKYLVSRATDARSDNSQAAKDSSTSSVVRQRLHILYIINDLLHHTKYHSTNPTLEAHFSESVQVQLPRLFGLARSEKRKNVGQRLHDLLQIWEHEQYLNKEFLTQLKTSVSSNGIIVDAETATPAIIAPTRETAYIMPPTHGDPTLPYYDLPAANLMPHIVPNKPIAMRSDQIKALQLSAGPADESLVNAVKDFLKDVERMENPYEQLDNEGLTVDVDDLGQLSYHNEADEVTCDTYYGWSKDFCEKMKRRGHEDNHSQSRNRSRSYSSGGSSRSRSRSRSRSFSRSSPKRRRHNGSRSPSPTRRRGYGSHSRSRSPERISQQTRTHPSLSQDFVPAMPPISIQNIPYPPAPLDPHALPIPPPRPLNYNGPWPPPPPQPPLLQGRFSSVPFPPPAPSFNAASNTTTPTNQQGRRR